MKTIPIELQQLQLTIPQIQTITNLNITTITTLLNDNFSFYDYVDGNWKFIINIIHNKQIYTIIIMKNIVDFLSCDSGIKKIFKFTSDAELINIYNNIINIIQKGENYE